MDGRGQGPHLVLQVDGTHFQGLLPGQVRQVVHRVDGAHGLAAVADVPAQDVVDGPRFVVQDTAVVVGAVDHGHGIVFTEQADQCQDRFAGPGSLQASLRRGWPPQTTAPFSRTMGRSTGSQPECSSSPRTEFRLRPVHRASTWPAARTASMASISRDPQHVVEFRVQQGAVHVDGHQQGSVFRWTCHPFTP